MRMTVNLDKDLYAVAKALARESETSISAAVNELIRRALARSPQAPAGGQQHDGTRTGKAGLPVVACRRTFTSEDVYRIDQESS